MNKYFTKKVNIKTFFFFFFLIINDARYSFLIFKLCVKIIVLHLKCNKKINIFIINNNNNNNKRKIISFSFSFHIFCSI